GKRILRRGAAFAARFRCNGKHHEPGADHRVDQEKAEDRESDARPRLGVAVDVGAVQQLADETLAPGRGGPHRWCGGDRHRVAPPAGIEPVAISPESTFWITEA